MADTMGTASAPRVGSLRGAQVADVDPSRLRAMALGVLMVALGVVAAVLFVAGAHRNVQVAALHDNGVPVTVTVAGCRGLLGGSGSNPVGYTCRGTFSLAGHREDVVLPGTALHSPGARVLEVADPSDPGLVSTPQAARTDHPSGSVYVVPSILTAALVALGVAVAVVRRRSTRLLAGLTGRLNPPSARPVP